ncbi:hypothetical protein, partial [Streptomyces sp. NPDC059656]
FEGVPPHLTLPLQMWLRRALNVDNAYRNDRAARVLCLRVQLTPNGCSGPEPDYMTRVLTSTGDELLDVIDALLAYKGERGIKSPGEVDDLDHLLDEGGSAYRVAATRDGLEERVTPAARDAVHQTIAGAGAIPAAGSAADHLAAAWRAAYGRNPDPVRAYSESIKAVESAAHAVIQANNAKATLGTMLGEFKQARHKFTTAIPSPASDPIAPVEAMMRALWEGQTSRHGAQSGTVPETLEAARAGVHLAAALVQWFVSGAVVRTP